MYYDTPRTYDAETLTTGATPSTAMIIPPKQKSWITRGECPKECSAVVVSKYIYSLLGLFHTLYLSRIVFNSIKYGDSTVETRFGFIHFV